MADARSPMAPAPPPFTRRSGSRRRRRESPRWSPVATPVLWPVTRTTAPEPIIYPSTNFPTRLTTSPPAARTSATYTRQETTAPTGTPPTARFPLVLPLSPMSPRSPGGATVPAPCSLPISKPPAARLSAAPTPRRPFVIALRLAPVVAIMIWWRPWAVAVASASTPASRPGRAPMVSV